MESILQEVIDLENGKLERQRFLHSTHSTHSEAALTPPPTPSSESKHKAYVAPPPPQEIRPAPAPKETSPQLDSLTSLMERMSISMAEMASKNMRIDELSAQVSKMSLEMANLNGPKPHSNQQYGQGQQYGQNQRYGPNLGPSYGPNQGGQFNNSRQYPGLPPPNRQYAPRNYSNACSVCGEEGHWRNDCATLSDLI